MRNFRRGTQNSRLPWIPLRGDERVIISHFLSCPLVLFYYSFKFKRLRLYKHVIEIQEAAKTEGGLAR